jgi:hypothetical protein
VTLVAGQYLDARPMALYPGSADEDRPQRLVADPLDGKIGLEALQLPTEGVSPRCRIDEAKVVGVADDQTGAGAEDRQTGLVESLEPGPQASRPDALGDRRALPPGDDQAIEPDEVFGGPNLRSLSAELPQGAGVGFEVALDS